MFTRSSNVLFSKTIKVNRINKLIEINYTKINFFDRRNSSSSLSRRRQQIETRSIYYRNSYSYCDKIIIFKTIFDKNFNLIAIFKNRISELTLLTTRKIRKIFQKKKNIKKTTMTIQKINKLKKINTISKITRFRNNRLNRTSLITTSSIR